MKSKSEFKVDWVLINELAVGAAPKKNSHVQILIDLGIVSVLSLCSENEATPPDLLKEKMHTSRIVLPDHKVNRLPNISEIEGAIEELKCLKKHGPVYVHCLAGVERSPLLCMSWLITQKNMKPERALAYIMEMHPGTCPLPEQLDVINELSRSTTL